MRAFHKSLTLETDLRMRRWRWFFLATVGLFVMPAKAGIQ